MVSVATNTDIKGLVHAHLPVLTPRYPIIPKHYVMPWKQDMKNRTLILKNAKFAGIPHGPHEVTLFWEQHERLCHGEERTGLLGETRYKIPQKLLNPPVTSLYSKYRSTLITRRDMPFTQ
ncbi:testis-expressed protein 43-like [Acipenser oxyrinchus oxyrinchus]|uniref:Testis-expressed protein 43-like n=1 Tax=Acipenser oxyrinchus oxyrinchus TaxID=40147 RepID=A0AAD8GHT0_ACIOX|nr:testis-expressed protein 43-like [Acipenser oxyrinchus oxyrinchus]